MGLLTGIRVVFLCEEEPIQFYALRTGTHKSWIVEANKVTASSTDVQTVQMTDHRRRVVSIHAIWASSGWAGIHCFYLNPLRSIGGRGVASCGAGQQRVRTSLRDQRRNAGHRTARACLGLRSRPTKTLDPRRAE